MRSRAVRCRPGRAVAGAAILLMCVACGGNAPTVASEAGVGPTASAEPSASPELTPEAVLSAEPVVVHPARTGRPSAKPSPRPTEGSSVLLLTEESAGRTIRVRVWQTIQVELPATATGGYVPPTSDSAVLHRAAADGGYPSGSPVQARFEAVRAGKADLTSSTDYGCLHAEPRCMLPQQIWTVHVVVIA